MQKKLLAFTEQLWQAIDTARGSTPRQVWMESHFWKSAAVRSAAKELGVQVRPPRQDNRGKWKREKCD